MSKSKKHIGKNNNPNNKQNINNNKQKVNQNQPNKNNPNKVNVTPTNAGKSNVTPSIKHDEVYLENSISKINNIATIGNNVKNISLGTNVSKYMTSEKTGMEQFIQGSTMLNSKVQKELHAMATLKDNYRALESKLRFGVDLKSELLDGNTLALNLLASNNKALEKYEKDHPYIQGNTYSKEEAERLYSKYFNNENLSSFFDLFYDKKTNTYDVPEIVFDKQEGKRNDNYYIRIDLTSGYTRKEIEDQLNKTIDALDPKNIPWPYNDSFVSKISYTEVDGVLVVDLTDLMKHLNKLNNAANGIASGLCSDADRAMLAEAINGMEDLFTK